MRKFVLSVALLLVATLSYSQNNPKFNDENNTQVRPEIEFMFEAVLINEEGFPTSAYSVADGANYMNQVQNWIVSNPEKYKLALNPNESYTHLTVKRSEYKKLNADQQLEFKNWFRAMESNFSIQNSSNNIKTYLLSQSDFSKLKTLLNK